jgi:glycosyltransferase involved in cell wall biosynthesis
VEREFDKKKIILLTVSRLSIEKGINYAIEAVSKLVRKYPGLEIKSLGMDQKNYKF